MENNNRKKLLVTASTFPRWENDTEPRFVLDLSIELTKYFDVTVLVPAAIGAKKWEIIEGVEIIRYHYFPIHKLETLCYPGAIVPRIKEKRTRILLVPFLFIALYINLFKNLSKYDVVHAHWLIPQGIVQSFFKKPYIVTGHGGDVTSLNKGIVKFLKRRCLKKAKDITVVSEYLKKRVIELYDIKNIDVISMGCDTKKFGKQFYTPNFFGQKDKKVVLFVGRLAEKKGVTYLIEAMREIDAVLAVVGAGPLERSLKEQAKDMKDKVLFLGSKNHEELKLIYASADIFVAPSITAKDGDQEGLGLIILEAMASGLPVVASKSGGIVDLIEDGVNGLLCEEKNVCQLANNIRSLLEDNLLYQRMKNNLETKIKRFEYDEIAYNYSKILMKGTNYKWGRKWIL